MVTIQNEKGTISITDEVFSNLAGDAATKCFGVKGMAGRSKDGNALQLLRRESMSKGVDVSFNEDESLSLDLHIGVDNNVNIVAVCRSIMNEVSYKIEKWTSRSVKNVDVYVDTVIVDKEKKEK